MNSYERRVWYEGQQRRMDSSFRSRHVAFVWRLFMVTLILAVAWILLVRA